MIDDKRFALSPTLGLYGRKQSNERQNREDINYFLHALEFLLKTYKKDAIILDNYIRTKCLVSPFLGQSNYYRLPKGREKKQKTKNISSMHYSVCSTVLCLP